MLHFTNKFTFLFQNFQERYGLYRLVKWVNDTHHWCDRIFTKKGTHHLGGTKLLLSYFLLYLNRMAQEINWGYIQSVLELKLKHLLGWCFIYNAYIHLKNSCHYLAKTLKVRGNKTLEKILFDSFHGPSYETNSSKCHMKVRAACHTVAIQGEMKIVPTICKSKILP